MKKKPIDANNLTLPEIGKALTDRWKLSNRYHTGALETLRSARTLGGKKPWRILRYQRIIEPEKSFLPVPNQNFVTPKTFEKHLRQLKRECNVVELDVLLQQIREKEKIPDRTVAITIDGGFMDTFLFAFPVIQENPVPVSVFLPTGFIGTDGMFWSDKVLLALLTMKGAGEKIEPFAFFREEYKAALAEVAPEGQITFQSIAVMIGGLRDADPALRHVAIALLGKIFTGLGGVLPYEPTFLSWEEVEIMEKFGVRFGSLGHRGAGYDELNDEETAADLTKTFETLAQHLQNPLPLLAAPDGTLSLGLIKTLHARGMLNCLLMDQTPDDFVFLETFFGLRRVTMYEAMTSTPELFFCKLWDIPYDVVL